MTESSPQTGSLDSHVRPDVPIEACQILNNFGDNFKERFDGGFDALRNAEGLHGFEGAIVPHQKNDFDGMVLDLLGGGQVQVN